MVVLLTYEHLESFVQSSDFSYLLLQLLDHLLLLLRALLGQVGDVADLLRSLLSFCVLLRVVLGQLAECLSGGRLNLERLHLFQNIRSVHTLYDRICVPDQLFFEHFGILRKDLQRHENKWLKIEHQ